MTLKQAARVAVGALLLGSLGSVSVRAQAHPCDVQPPAAIATVSSPVTIGFCHTGKDTNGTATTITQFTVRIGTVATLAQALSPLSAANAAGARYYQFSPLAAPHGTYTVTITATNATGVSSGGTTTVCVACSYTITIGPTVPPPTTVTFATIVTGVRPRGYGVSPYSLSVPAGGRIAYSVSTTGNDANVGSAASPFRTINKAAQVALGGDVVTIQSGTYNESVTVAHGGTASAPIVFQAATRGGVILSGGTHTFKAVNWNGGLQNTGAIWVTIKGLIFRNYSPFLDGQTPGEGIGGIKGWRIEDCLFDAAGQNATNLRGDDITVTRSTFQGSGRHAIIGFGPCGASTGPDDPTLVGMQRMVITDNIIRANNTDTSAQAAGDGSAVIKLLTSRNALIENNESHGNWGPGLWLDSCNADYLVRYNYLHDNLTRNAAARGLDIEISWRGKVEWNVISGNAMEGLSINNTSEMTVTNNLFNGNRRSVVITAADRGARFQVFDVSVQNNQFRDWKEFAAIEGLIAMTNTAFPAANNIVVNNNVYQPITSTILSGWWGYFISTLTQNCTDIGWECNGRIGTITWPPQ